MLVFIKKEPLMSAALFTSVNGRILFLAKKRVDYRFIDAHRIGLELLFNCLGLCLGGHIEFERHKVPVNIAHMQRQALPSGSISTRFSR